MAEQVGQAACIQLTVPGGLNGVLYGSFDGGHWVDEGAVLTLSAAQQLDDEAATRSIRDVAAYLQEAIGQRVAAAMAGLSDAKQIGRYARENGPRPHVTTERRLREGYKVVRMLADTYDEKTARAWLFGTNTRLDDRAPIEVLGAASETAEFAMVVRAARQLASSQSRAMTPHTSRRPRSTELTL